MKRCNTVILFGAVLMLFLMLQTGCRSTPSVYSVNPLELIDGGSSFFISMPASADNELVKKIIQEHIHGLNNKGTEAVASRVSMICVGFNRSWSGTELQVAAEGSVPSRECSRLFTKKNGWQTDKLLLPAGENKDGAVYSYYTGENGMQVCFPSDTIVCFGSHVSDMVTRYNTLCAGGVPEGGPVLDNDIKKWLSTSSAQIRFYADKPQSFLTILTGANLNLKLVYAKGLMVIDPEQPDEYLLTLEFEFRDLRTIPAGEAMLSLAFGLTGYEMKLDTPSHLTVSGIKISRKQLYKLLAL